MTRITANGAALISLVREGDQAGFLQFVESRGNLSLISSNKPQGRREAPEDLNAPREPQPPTSTSANGKISFLDRRGSSSTPPQETRARLDYLNRHGPAPNTSALDRLNRRRPYS
jgi:hypothetical protein